MSVSQAPWTLDFPTALFFCVKDTPAPGVDTTCLGVTCAYNTIPDARSAEICGCHSAYTKNSGALAKRCVSGSPAAFWGTERERGRGRHLVLIQQKYEADRRSVTQSSWTFRAGQVHIPSQVNPNVSKIRSGNPDVDPAPWWMCWNMLLCHPHFMSMQQETPV